MPPLETVETLEPLEAVEAVQDESLEIVRDESLETVQDETAESVRRRPETAEATWRSSGASEAVQGSPGTRAWNETAHRPPGSRPERDHPKAIREPSESRPKAVPGILRVKGKP